jgi:UDP-N-acetylmuramoyl-tripeptide--D-alanyl-D-alanine ligase
MTTEQLHQLFLKHPTVSTDSRKVEPNSLFFALKGANFDGNKYAAEAIKKGAAFAIVDDPGLPEHEKFVLVNDVLESLQKLATYHRKKLNVPVLGITGTNGKTTTKELIVAVLQKKYRVTFTSGNLNNHIGVPLTLLKMDSQTQLAVVEMGANHVGEIDQLCHIADPDIGLITNIGKAHLEGFGSFEGVIKTKSELYDYLREKAGTCFINSDNELLMKQAGDLEKLTYGTGNAQLKGELQESGYYLTVKALFPKGWLYLKSKLIGSYNFENILAAARVGLHFGVDPLDIQKAIENYQPTNNRSQLILKGTNKIFMDAYNANPTSMLASLKNFAGMKGPSKTVILGDMLELGNQSLSEHQKIADLATSLKLDTIYLVGKEFEKTSTGLKTKKFGNTELLSGYLSQHKPIENNLILIKGSRGIQLEKILESI